MSKIIYDKLAVEGIREVLQQVRQACNELDLDFFLVGAIARNIWFAINEERPSGTKDIDFGIYVPSEVEYNKLRDLLMTKYNYHPSKENAFCLITENGKQVDLLPFGSIEEDGQVMIEGQGLQKINLDGFEEAFLAGSQEVIIGDEKYKSCSIPGVVILKMIAFDDRPERRIKDIKDIHLICKHYPILETNLIWDKHNDLYENDREHDEVAMIVLGREMKEIVGDNNGLKKRILNIIDKALKGETNFLKHMIENPQEETMEQKSRILEYIRRGFSEE